MAWFDATGRKYPNPVLYHACMSDHPALVARLLERGANPNDGESIYHAAQYNRRSCLELLRQHGADFSSRQKPYNNTPLFFLAGHHDEHGGNAPWAQGVRWLLEHGADPNVTSYGHNSTPLHALATGGRDQVLRWVVEWGADVNAVRRDGRTPYAIALRSGNEAGARYLIEQGASPGATPMDEFLGACLTADEPVARSLLERHTDLMSSMTAEDQGAIGNAIRWNRPHAVRLMHTLGFQLNWEEAGGGTPLHWAAWLGRHEIVKLLLELGAPVNARDRQYGSSPIAWAAHGSRFNNHEGADDHYCAIVDVLIDAGAERTVSINKAGVPPEILATPRVQEKLVERGFA
jgi:ankyrin repeat protein